MLLSRIEPLLPSIRALALVSIGIVIGLRHASQANRGASPRSSSDADTAIQHREDIKSLIRKRYGSVTAFEKALGLTKASVADVLRGKASARVAVVVAEELDISLADLLRVTRPDVDLWICGGDEKNFRFRKARRERRA